MRRTKNDYYDYNLVAALLLLVGFGLVMLYSTSAYSSTLTYGGNDMYLFNRQSIISLVTILIAIGASYLIDYHLLWYLSPLLYAASAVLMMLVKSPLGVTHHGARRWLKIGIEFQPSEIAKVAVIMFLPFMILKLGKRFHTLRWTVLTLSAGLLQALITYYFTDNLSTAVIIAAISWFIVFVAHEKTWPFIAAMIVGVILTVVFVLVLWNIAESGGDFRLQRILVWRDPEAYSASGGWQILQALYAIGSGGFLGKGLGNSVQKRWLPEAQNDMIFSIICEELGIFGGAIVILLFLYLLYRLIFIAQNAPDRYGSLMVSGIFTHIALQVILNICVVLNLIPTTGVTLPFISYGGTSVLFLMSEMSIALMVSRKIRFKTREELNWGTVVEGRKKGRVK